MTYEEMGLDQFLRSLDSPTRDNVGWENRGRVRNTILRNSSITDAKIDSLNANKITAGTINASEITVSNIPPDDIASGTYPNTMNVGTAAGGYVRMDGANTRFIVHDGSNNRILIGYHSGGF